MIYVRDGLSFSNENSTLGHALARFIAKRKRNGRRKPAGTTPDRRIRQSSEPHAAIRVAGIDHVNLSVANLERAMDFYESVFGFRLVEDGRGRTDAPFVIMTAGGRAFLALHESTRVKAPSRPFINHWGFVVGDINLVRHTLEDHQVKIQDGDSESGGVRHWPHSRSIYVYDPDGHEIELAEVFGGGLAA